MITTPLLAPKRVTCTRSITQSNSLHVSPQASLLCAGEGSHGNGGSATITGAFVPFNTAWTSHTINLLMGPVAAGFIGGTREDIGRGIAVDGVGNVYVVGQTDSSEATFPVTGGVGLSHYGGYRDAFVAAITEPSLQVSKADWYDPLCPGFSQRYEIVITNTSLIMVTGVTVTDSTKQASALVVTPGQTVTYTITLANTGAGDATDARLTDTLPLSLTYQAGSLWAARGSFGEAGGVITWTGAIPAGTATTAHYAAVVSPALSISDTVALVNTLWIDDGISPLIERRAAVFINPFQVWLPLTAR